MTTIMDIYWDDQDHLWCVTGYELACETLADSRFSSDTSHYLLDTTFPRDRREVVRPLNDYFQQWLFYHDPPAHTALRKQISAAFSQQAIAQYESTVAKIVAAVCSPLTGEFDFVDHVAKVIPSRSMAQFLSLPEQDAALYVRWTLAMGDFIDGYVRTPHEYQPALDVLNEQTAYFSTIKSEWVSEQTHQTLLPMLLTTGIETSISFLASGLHTLLTHPHAWQQLQREPQLLDQAIDELLRFEPPVLKTVRQATVDCTYHGCDIKKGDMISVSIVSANRDPRIFTSPDVFDIMRKPVLNLSFGYGIHYCLGRLLGRLVARQSFQYLLTHWPHIQLTGEPVVWHMGTVLRRLEKLPVRITI